MPKCIIHSRTHRLWYTCPECGKDAMMKNAADELFQACQTTKDIIKQINALTMDGPIELIKKRLVKAEQACDKAIQLALTGEQDEN